MNELIEYLEWLIEPEQEREREEFKNQLIRLMDEPSPLG